MDSNESIKAKVAKALLDQHDAKKRKRLILSYAAVLVFLFLIHSYFSNLESPLKLIPQTMSAIGMGYVILLVLSLKRFAYVAEFIDWPRVKETAEQAASSNR